MTEDRLSWETVDRSVAYSCAGFDVINETVRLPDGTETDFDYVSEPPSVAVLPLTGDGQVVLIEEWRQAVDRVNRGIPAGTAEMDDPSLEAAAARELREETGYEAGDLETLGTVEPANGIADAVLHLFVGHDCTPSTDQSLDVDESIRVSPESWASLRERVAAGDVRDGRTVLAVSRYCLEERG